MKLLALHRGEQCLVPQVWHARRWPQRLRGLLGRAPLRPGQGLLIEPCASVHTFAMGYPLDLLFLSRGGQVLGWREALPPWRAAAQRGARSTLELPAGSLARIAPSAGETLSWRAAGDVPAMPPNGGAG